MPAQGDDEPPDNPNTGVTAAIVTIDADGVVQYASRALERMFGHPVESIVGRHITILMGEPDAGEQHEKGPALDLGSVSTGYNVQGRRADGSNFPIQLIFETIEGRDLAGYFGVLTDRSAANGPEPRLRAAVDALSEGFALFDHEHRLVLFNEQYRAILGLEADVLTSGVAFSDHVASLGFSVGPLAGEGHADEGGLHRYQLADGRSVLARLTFLRSGDAIVSVQDETEAENRAAAIAQADRLRALGELTGGVAHDFNNLLAVVIGNLELLSEHLHSPQGRAMATEALDAAEIGARLTDRLLAFARRQPLAAETFDVNDLIRSIAAILERTLGPHVALTLALDPAVRTISVDRGALESGLVNLATNARDAMPGGGSLTIATHARQLGEGDVPDVPAGSFAAVSVTDTGAGMGPEVAQRAIEPFFTTKPKGQGSGLGLSSFYGFAKQSGGGLVIRSTVGEGTTIEVFLPVAGKRALAVDARPLEGKALLVVDDDPRVRRVCASYAQALGGRVLQASRASEALTVVRSETVHCVLSDVVMPGGMDGYTLAAQLWEHDPSLPVLLMTGYSDEALRAGRIGDPRFRVLRKPFKQNELAAALALLLRVDQ